MSIKFIYCSLTAILCSFLTISYAQQSLIDSLVQVASKQNDDSLRADYYYKAIGAATTTNPQKAIALAEEHKVLLEKYPSIYSKTLVEIAWAHKYLGQNDEAVEAINECLLLPTDSSSRFNAIFTKGNFEYYNFKLSAAFEHFKQAESFFLSIQNKERLASIYNSTASVLVLWGQFKEAEKVYLKTLNLVGDADQKMRQHKISTIYNLIYLYLQTSNYTDALSYIYKHKALLKQWKYEEQLLAYSHLSLAALYLELADFDNSMTHFQKIDSLYDGNIPYGILPSLASEKAKYYIQREIPDSAIVYNELFGDIIKAQQYLLAMPIYELGKAQIASITNNLDTVQFYFNKVKAVASTKKLYPLEIENLLCLAKTLSNNQQFDSALTLLEEAFRKVKYINDGTKYYYEIQQQQLTIFEQTGAVANAALLSKQMSAAHDTIGLTTTGKKIALQGIFQLEQQLIKELEQSTLKPQQTRDTRKFLSYSSLYYSLITIALLLTFHFIYTYKSSTKRLKELNAQLSKELVTKNTPIANEKAILFPLNEKIGELQNTISDVYANSRDKKHKVRLSTLKHKIEQLSVSYEDYWEEVQVLFQQNDPNFFKALLKLNAHLTQNDLKQCAYLRMNYSVAETAKALNVTPGAVTKARYRLKKKLHLEEENLHHFIMNL